MQIFFELDSQIFGLFLRLQMYKKYNKQKLSRNKNKSKSALKVRPQFVNTLGEGEHPYNKQLPFPLLLPSIGDDWSLPAVLPANAVPAARRRSVTAAITGGRSQAGLA